jgi:hypothetical protein
MIRKTKLAAGVLGIALATTGVSFMSATTASASGNCNYSSMNGGGYVCTNYDPAGYQAVWEQTGAPRGDYLDFNLDCVGGWFGDGGAYQPHSTGNFTYVFSVGSQGTCHVTIYDRSSGAQQAAPQVTR